MKTILKNQAAMGFVESLIAIVVAGIACVALLSLGASVIRESTKTEMRDAMSQYANEGLEKVKYMNIVSPGVVQCHPGSVRYYYISADQLIPVLLQSDLCSVEGKNGECEKLKLRLDGSDLFYREVDVECAGAANQVTLRVGTLESGYNLSEVKLIGYLP